jgi:lipopolysaccharide biosynthesis protein
MTGTTCLFAHFNARGHVCAHVHRYISELSSLGCRIAFISNSPVRQEDRLMIEKNKGVYRIAERENKGNDFGAWQWAFANGVIPEDTDLLLLTNDSIFGPLFPLEPLFQKMHDNPSVDFWGLTDSYQGGWHIQSYFLCLSKRVFRSDAFRKVLIQNFSTFDKKTIIEKGEIGLSKACMEAGFTGSACFPYENLDPCALPASASNPTHFFWDLLIKRWNFPFIKKELILFNPERLQSVGDVFSFLERTTRYPVELIRECILDHLQARSDRARSLTFPEDISILCHLYYPATIYSFLSRLAVLNTHRARFIFNLSAALAHDRHFTRILTDHFDGAVILHTPDQGRDIGGKLAAVDVFLKCGFQSAYSLVIHDKNSPHTPTGRDWGNSLLRIIEPEILPKVFSKFSDDPDTGIITSSHFIKTEFDPDKNGFTATSSNNLLRYIEEYDLTISDHYFAAGTIFWIRTEILTRFFAKYPPMSVRRGLERGNALDFTRGTNIHAWERLFSFITDSLGYKTTGIY